VSDGRGILSGVRLRDKPEVTGLFNGFLTTRVAKTNSAYKEVSLTRREVSFSLVSDLVFTKELSD
jgi:hypothetical protein